MQNGAKSFPSPMTTHCLKLAEYTYTIQIEKDKRQEVVVCELWATSTLLDSVGTSDMVAGREHLTRQPFL